MRSAEQVEQPGLRAVLFDMDGLLISSEETWFEAETEVVAALASPQRPVTWGPEHQKALVGGPLHVTARYLLDLTGASIPREQVETMLVDAMEQRLRSGPVRWMPGARELLIELAAAGVPCALVSASVRRLVDAVLDAVGTDVPGAFRTTVAGDEVVQTKPAPDPYLLAAQRLDAEPARCLVLEDSPTGATAGLAAGCPTIAVPSLVAIAERPGLAVFPSLTDLDVGRLEELAAVLRRQRPDEPARSVTTSATSGVLANR